MICPLSDVQGVMVSRQESSISTVRDFFVQKATSVSLANATSPGKPTHALQTIDFIHFIDNRISLP
jgi:hypothetical protein